MAGYISEFQYYGDTSQEFIEIALPQGTDPSGYQIEIYDSEGELIYVFSLGASTGTMGGHDVYVVDSSTPGFDDGGSDPTGNLYPDDAIALVDGNGNVQQFVSYWGNTVEADEGSANGMTSTDVGTAGQDQSLQSDDGGSTYYAQSSPNSGSIPACFATGSLIATPRGERPVEELEVGDLILTGDGRACPIRWIQSEKQMLEAVAPDQKPVLIRSGAFGPGLPDQDLVVSGQHRIVVGAYGQLENIFDHPLMVPAKALVDLPRVRFMKARKTVTWHHILCDSHNIVFAHGLASETLLLGPMVVQAMGRGLRAELTRSLGRPVTGLTSDRPTLPCLTVGEARRWLTRGNTRPLDLSPRIACAEFRQSA